MPLFIERDFLCQLGHEVWTFGPRSNEAHLTFQDVPELRDLIHANFPYDAADARGASVPLAGPNRTILFGVNPHRVKLRQREDATVFAHTFLLVKDRTSRF